jgi:hypothetical protein
MTTSFQIGFGFGKVQMEMDVYFSAKGKLGVQVAQEVNINIREG